MGNLFAELKRRHIYRVAAAYAVVAWIVLQIVNNIAPALNLPNWALSFVLVLLVLGFPIALVFAWILHLASPEANAQTKSGAVDWVLAGALTLVIALIAFEQMGTRAGAPGQASILPPAPQQAGISIAVLPFANVSGDAAQEFFSDGMTDEIIAALAKVPSLQVVGRTSAFQFKGNKSDLRAIGQALNARYLIDGSVRKAGDRVRITAQLVQADNGVGVWTDSYDRELKDIFATQSDIAQAIAGALRVPLGLKQGESLVGNRASDVGSYQQYLRARSLVRARGAVPGSKVLTDAVALLEQAVARDPAYAPAWALLALAYDYLPLYESSLQLIAVEEARRIVDASLAKAEAAARRAIQLDSNLANGYAALALAQHAHEKLLMAEELYLKALALDANSPDALQPYSILLSNVGRLKEALVMRQHLRTLEPFVPVFNTNTAIVLAVNGQNEAAIAILNALPPDSGAGVRAQIYAAEGRYGEAADALLRLSSGQFPPETVEAAARLLRTAPATATSPQTLPNFERMALEWVYLYVGAPDRVRGFNEIGLEIGYVGLGAQWVWHPSYASTRKTERFKAYLRAAGYVEYWRVKGWPEFCHPTTGDDFECS